MESIFILQLFILVYVHSRCVQVGSKYVSVSEYLEQRNKRKGEILKKRAIMKSTQGHP